MPLFMQLLIPMLVFHFIRMDKGEYFEKKKGKRSKETRLVVTFMNDKMKTIHICQLQHVLDLCSSWGHATLFFKFHISIKGTCLAKSQ